MDLANFPTSENDECEFKSSTTDRSALALKLAAAGSAFANTGGGWFLAGVDDAGSADGGIECQIGRQALGDWVDIALHKIEPAPEYSIEFIKDLAGRGALDGTNVVLAVRFEESLIGPHMAPDNKYYIRAGAHTVPARHFIVESIRAKRQVAKPRLVHRVNSHPFTQGTERLGIDLVAISDAAALDVQVDITTDLDRESPFPLTETLVDRANPLSVWFEVPSEGFETQLKVMYSDALGNRYSHTADIDSKDCVPAWNSRPYRRNEIGEVLRDIERAIRDRGGGISGI